MNPATQQTANTSGPGQPAPRPVVDVTDPVRPPARPVTGNLHGPSPRGQSTFDPDASLSGPTAAELAALQRSRISPSVGQTMSPSSRPRRLGTPPASQRVSSRSRYRGRSTSRSSSSSSSSGSDDGSRGSSRNRDSRSRSQRHGSRAHSPPSPRRGSPAHTDSRHSSHSRRSRSPRHRGDRRRRSRSPESIRSSTRESRRASSATGSPSPVPSATPPPAKTRRSRKTGPPRPEVSVEVARPIIDDACARYWLSMSSSDLGFFPTKADIRTHYAKLAFDEANTAAGNAGKGTIPYWHSCYRKTIDGAATNAKAVIKKAAENFPVTQYSFKPKDSPEQKRKWVGDWVARPIGTRTVRMFLHIVDEDKQQIRYHQQPTIATAWRALFIDSDYAEWTLRFASVYEKVPLETVALAAVAIQFSIEYRSPDSPFRDEPYSTAKFEAKRYGAPYRTILDSLRTAANADAHDEEHLGLETLRAELAGYVRELVQSRIAPPVAPENQSTTSQILNEHGFFALRFTDPPEELPLPPLHASAGRYAPPMHAQHPSAPPPHGHWQNQAAIGPPHLQNTYPSAATAALTQSFINGQSGTHAQNAYSHGSVPNETLHAQNSQQFGTAPSEVFQQQQYTSQDYAASSSGTYNGYGAGYDGYGGSHYGGQDYRTYDYSSGQSY